MKGLAYGFAVLGVGLVGLIGCFGWMNSALQKGGDDAVESPLEAVLGGDVEVEEEMVRVQADGQTLAMGTGAKFPEEWPSTISAYPGSQMLMSSADASSGTHSMMAVQQTSDPSEKVVAFYKANCTGCAIQTEVDIPGQGHTVIFTLPQPPHGSFTLSTMVTPDQPTMVTLVLSR